MARPVAEAPGLDGPATPVDLLVRGGCVVTMDADRRVLADGAVAIDGGRIVAVGETADVAGRFTPRHDPARGRPRAPACAQWRAWRACTDHRGEIDVLVARQMLAGEA